MKKKISFAIDFARYALTGGIMYYSWLLFLGFFILIMVFTAYRQFTEGLIVTGVTDQNTWELYIVNFVFMVGVAAAAVTVVFPSYIYKHRHLKEIYVLGEILAMVAVPMCILFILFHMGRPDRLWHILPGIGFFNLPHSMLDWDVVALNGYLFFNVVAAFYYLYKRYTGGHLHKIFYMTLIYLCIIWAPTIHILTAFILNTMPAIPLWATSSMPIRFISTAFSAGPALIIMIFLIIRKNTKLAIHDKAIDTLSEIMVWCLGITLLLLVSEVVTELYPGTEHSHSLMSIMFGMHGVNKLVPWFWSSVILLTSGFIMLLIPRLRKDYKLYLPMACAMVFAGVWIEKGMNLVIPAFNPTPVGEFIEYTPSWIEIFNTIGIWALGAFAFTLLTKGAVGVLVGDVSYSEEPSYAVERGFAEGGGYAEGSSYSQKEEFAE
jgi:molybdopterin-containing oxidoreductase family membrane subunit